MDNLENFIPAISVHPGKTLEDKLKEIKMSVQEFAVLTSTTTDAITSVIEGRSSINANMAVAFENITHIHAHFWLNKQRHYNEYLTKL